MIVKHAGMEEAYMKTATKQDYLKVVNGGIFIQGKDTLTSNQNLMKLCMENQ